MTAQVSCSRASKAPAAATAARGLEPPERLTPRLRLEQRDERLAREHSAQQLAQAVGRREVAGAAEEDKDSSTGHEGDGSEDAGTTPGTNAGKGPTPDSKRRGSRGEVRSTQSTTNLTCVFK